MKKEILICDRCKKEYEPKDGIEFRVNMGTEMDPSGNGYNNIWKYYDFCRECISAKMQFFVDERRGML